MLPLALALLAAAPQSSDAAIADAQRRFRAAISVIAGPDEKRETPADADPCVTRYAITYWGRPPAVETRIDWRRADYARFQQETARNDVGENRIEIGHGTDIAVIEPRPDQIDAILAAAGDLIGLCRTVAPAGPPLPVGTPLGPHSEPGGAIGERNRLEPLVPGTHGHRCVFTAVPEVVLEYDRAPANFARYEARPRILVFDINTLEVDLYRATEAPAGDADGVWRTLRATLYFNVGSGAYQRLPIASAKAFVDARPLDFALDVIQGPDPLDPALLNHYVSVHPRDHGDDAAMIAAIARGSVTEIRLYDAEGNWAGRWDYDVRTLHDMPAALAAADWRCP